MDILIVDDSEDAAQLLSSMFRELGYDCGVALNSNDAISLSTIFRPAIVLLDLMMPEMDGFAVAGTIRKRLKDSVPKMVAVTGIPRNLLDDRLLADNFDALFLKGNDIKELRTLVDKFLTA